MNVNERREKERQLLLQKPFVSLEELIAQFPEVSSMTLRRDIEYLEKHGEAIKVRGGARSMKFITTSMEDSYTKRLRENTREKELVAQRAAQMIETGRSVFIDSGTTMLALARNLPDERVNILTTGPNVALELIKKSKAIVSIIGGMLNRDNISVVGTQAVQYVENVNVDTAFIVPSGISTSGITCGNYSECELKKAVIKKARQVVVVVNLSKVDKILPYTVCGFEDIDMIITDQLLPEALQAECKKNRVRMVLA